MARGKYEALATFLAGRGNQRVTMTFAELDVLVGGLPRSARVYRAWWSNEEDGRHVQAHAWMRAGFRADEVELGERVTFVPATRSRT